MKKHRGPSWGMVLFNFILISGGIADALYGIHAMTNGANLSWDHDRAEMLVRIISAISLALWSIGTPEMTFHFARQGGWFNYLFRIPVITLIAVACVVFNMLNAALEVNGPHALDGVSAVIGGIEITAVGLHQFFIIGFVCLLMPLLAVIRTEFGGKSVEELEVELDRKIAKRRLDIRRQRELAPLDAELGKVGGSRLIGLAQGTLKGVGLMKERPEPEGVEDEETPAEMVPQPAGAISTTHLAKVLSKGAYKVGTGKSAKRLSAVNGARTVVNWLTNPQPGKEIAFTRRVVGHSSNGKEIVQYSIDEAAIMEHPHFGEYYKRGLQALASRAKAPTPIRAAVA